MIVQIRIVDDLGKLIEAMRAPTVIGGAQVGDTLLMDERRLLAREWVLSTDADLVVTARESERSEESPKTPIAEVQPVAEKVTAGILES